MHCPLCNYQYETSDHCLFYCKRAKDIWKLTFDHVFLEEDFRGSVMDRWFKLNETLSMENLKLVAVTCWSIWNDRNKYVHGEIIPDINFKSQWIVKYLEDFRKANPRNSERSMNNRGSENTSSRPNECWKPSQVGSWKLNCDAACVVNPPSTGVGAICRNKDGKAMAAEAKYQDFYLDPLSAELWAILEGVQRALSLGCMRLEIESTASKPLILSLGPHMSGVIWRH